MMKKATQIFFNAIILTMDEKNSQASAIALDGDKILAIGTKDSLSDIADKHTKYTNLQEATVLPGFYDAHGHFFMNCDARDRRVDLNSPPIGGCINLEDCYALLEKKGANIPVGEWIMAYGFDDTRIEENRYPTRWELDKVSAEHPIYVQHISGHLGALNSKGLEVCNITRDTPDPEGGVIRRDATGEPNGVLEESILYKQVRPKLPKMSREQGITAMENTGFHYASKGVTSTIDAAVMNLEEVTTAVEAVRQNRFPIRLLYNPYDFAAEEAHKIPSDPAWVVCGGTKIIGDGSLQGFTGYLSRPYHTPYEGDATFRGYPRHNREALFALIAKVHATSQVIAHINGDAAAEDVLDALEEALRHNPRKDHRHMLIHAQTIREDQLDRAAQLGVTISFFTPHVFYWGDRHRDIFLGPERAARLNPMRSALQRGIVVSSHCDTPIVPVDPLLSIWACVNRLTSTGKTLGAEQSISVLEALRAHTVNPAWQNFDEQLKGSIEKNKYADFVVLETNPLTCDPKNINKIKILATYVGGKQVFEA